MRIRTRHGPLVAIIAVALVAFGIHYTNSASVTTTGSTITSTFVAGTLDTQPTVANAITANVIPAIYVVPSRNHLGGALPIKSVTSDYAMLNPNAGTVNLVGPSVIGLMTLYVVNAKTVPTIRV